MLRGCRRIIHESLLFVMSLRERFSRACPNRAQTAVFRASNNSLSGPLGLRGYFRAAGCALTPLPVYVYSFDTPRDDWVDHKGHLCRDNMLCSVTFQTQGYLGVPHP